MLWHHGSRGTGRGGEGREASAIFSHTASRRVCRLITSAKASIMKCLKASQGCQAKVQNVAFKSQKDRKEELS
jgi:hypothetical protein